MEQQKLPNATLILVFGILSIVTCCCYGIIGLALGIVAIVLAKKATQIYAENPELYTGIQNVKTGKILAIIGIVLSLLYIIFVIAMIAMFGFEALQDQELLQERMREFMGQ
ncbi:CCC motif membrane protein [Thalassobellus suaedae]|uniref:CCC motif membrane protein n=1 Tax=Thalassobellus suaedae TaxID=3074124 RepID=A0ABY9XVJ5_9FLAO|nr:CCC motif membrane protein [Flavobacteriaceae bacterium HL-DH14]